MYPRSALITRPSLLALAFVMTFLCVCTAQEVAVVDLTKVGAKADSLRRPKATSPARGGYGSSGYTYSCQDDRHSAGALKTTLVSLDNSRYQLGDEPIIEVTIENTGSTAIRIPVSPHISDLQPKDPAQKFAYYELRIALWIAGGERWAKDTGENAGLVGSDDHADTTITLNPGEWLRVVAKGHLALDDELLQLPLSEYPADHAYAETSLYKAQTLITATQSATVLQETCLTRTPGQGVPMQLILKPN